MLTLYHTTRCPNCHAQEKILQQMQAQDPELAFQLINLEQSPDLPISPPIQSVPTLYINEYRFEGLMTANDIKKWLGPEKHDKAYLNELLKSGQLQLAQQWLQQHPAALPCIAELLADEDIEMTVRIGLDAIIEQLATDHELVALTHPLGKLLGTVSDSLCIDVLHYLAMIGSEDARQYVQACVSRPHLEVKRNAQELLAEWHTATNSN